MGVFQQPSSPHMGEPPYPQDKAKGNQDKDRNLEAIPLDQSLRPDSLSYSFNLVNYLNSLLSYLKKPFLLLLKFIDLSFCYFQIILTTLE